MAQPWRVRTTTAGTPSRLLTCNKSISKGGPAESEEPLTHQDSRARPGERGGVKASVFQQKSRRAAEKHFHERARILYTDYRVAWFGGYETFFTLARKILQGFRELTCPPVLVSVSGESPPFAGAPVPS